MTVSEGVGVGLLLNGQLVHGAHAMTGEFGHVSIDEERAALRVRAATVAAGKSDTRPTPPRFGISRKSQARLTGHPTSPRGRFEHILRRAD